MLAIEIGRKTFALLPTPANNTCRLSDQRRRRNSGRGGRPRPRILEEARRVSPEPLHGRALRLVSGEEEADDRGQEGDDDRRPARVLNCPPRNAAQAAESALARLGGGLTAPAAIFELAGEVFRWSTRQQLRRKKKKSEVEVFFLSPSLSTFFFDQSNFQCFPFLSLFAPVARRGSR